MIEHMVHKIVPLTGLATQVPPAVCHMHDIRPAPQQMRTYVGLEVKLRLSDIKSAAAAGMLGVGGTVVLSVMPP